MSLEIKRYWPKPVAPAEAVQIKRENLEEVGEWAAGEVEECSWGPYLSVCTRYGFVAVLPGRYVIKNADGTVDVMSEIWFKKKFMEVEEDDRTND